MPRTALRHRVLPELRGALGQDPAPALARVARLLDEDEEALAIWAAEVLVQARRGTTKGSQDGLALDVAVLSAQPRAVRGRVVLAAWKELGEVGDGVALPPLSEVHVAALDQLVMNIGVPGAPAPGAQTHLPGGWIAHRDATSLAFTRLEGRGAAGKPSP